MPRRRIFAFCLAAATLWAFAGCGGCEKDRPHPSRYVPQGADGVFEVKSVGLLAERKTELRRVLSAAFPGGQLDALEAQVVRALGFDPTTPEGLATAGVPKKGALAVRVADHGKGALWVVPVDDPKKFGKTIATLAASRASIDSDETKTIGKHPVRVFSTSWGTSTVPVAAVATSDGYGFVGAGRRAPELVAEALGLAKKDSILEHPEYRALDGALGQGFMARFIVPTATVSAAMLVNRDSLPKGGLADLAREMKSIGWGFDLSKNTVSVRGRVRVKESARDRVAKVLVTKGAAPKGVLGIGALDSLILVVVAGDPTALLAALAPPGSTARRRLTSAINPLNDSVGVDVEKDVLPKLSGHGALAVGVGDLNRLPNIAALVRNPGLALWTASGFGLRESMDDMAAGMWTQLDPALQRRGLLRDARKIGDVPITVVGIPDPAEPTKVPAERVVLETFTAADTWVMANAAGRTEAVLKAIAKPPKDPLSGQGGLRARVDFAAAATALRSADLAKLAGSGMGALTVRAMAGKILTILDAFQDAVLHITAASDGLAVSLEVRLAERSDPS